MRQLSGVRKADAAHGDDTTLTRFVKLKNDEGEPRHRIRLRQPRLPGLEAAFVREARTKFPTRVLLVSAMPKLLVSAHSNVKIGRDVRKGRLKGYWIYLLSLEERKTCPPSCKHWQSCYGNQMPFAKRINHDDPDFLPRLKDEIAVLYHQRKGKVLLRLHQLGDFYSESYVDFWLGILRQYPLLQIFGYTARMPETPIGGLVVEMNRRYRGRCMIRFSNSGRRRMSTVSIGSAESVPANTFICPEQTGKTRCCATCGACWSTTKNVAFLEH